MVSLERSTSNVRTSASMLKYRHLIWNFTQRDLKSKFQGTSLGWAWSLIVPLATVVIYTRRFRRRVPASAAPTSATAGRAISRSGSSPGWSRGRVFASVDHGGMPSLLSTGPLLQKVYIPSYVPVLGAAGCDLHSGARSSSESSRCSCSSSRTSAWTWLSSPCGPSCS